MRKKFNTLLHLSGGMDSTYCLWKRLTDYPEERILVHHVKLRHRAEDRMLPEERACQEIIQWLRAQGLHNFEFMQSHFEYGDLPRISIKDIQIVTMFSGIILRTPEIEGIERIILPWHKGEVNNDENNKGYRVKAMLQALESPKVELQFPIENMTRADMAKDMPRELLALCSFCRRPNEAGPCRKCKTCHEMIEAKLL